MYYRQRLATNGASCQRWCATEHDYYGDGRLCVGERDVLLPDHLDVRVQQRVLPSGRTEEAEVFVALAGTTVRLTHDEATSLSGALAWAAREIELTQWQANHQPISLHRHAEAATQAVRVGRHRAA
jgi:hypothetical protein